MTLNPKKEIIEIDIAKITQEVHLEMLISNIPKYRKAEFKPQIINKYYLKSQFQ